MSADQSGASVGRKRKTSDEVINKEADALEAQGKTPTVKSLGHLASAPILMEVLKRREAAKQKMAGALPPLCLPTHLASEILQWATRERDAGLTAANDHLAKANEDVAQMSRGLERAEAEVAAVRTEYGALMKVLGQLSDKNDAVMARQESDSARAIAAERDAAVAYERVKRLEAENSELRARCVELETRQALWEKRLQNA